MSSWRIGGLCACAFVCIGSGCGDSVSMDAEGLDHVQEIDFNSSISSDSFGGGSEMVYAASIAISQETMVVHGSHSRSSYDFNIGERLRKEGALVVFEREGGGWREVDFLTATISGGVGAGLGRHIALAEAWLFATNEDQVLVFERTAEGWLRRQVLEPDDRDSWCNPSLATAGATLVVVDGCGNLGRAVTFELLENTWGVSQEQWISNLGETALGDCVSGRSVALTEHHLFVSRPSRSRQGFVSAYPRGDHGFGEPQLLTSPTSDASFGCDLAVFGNRIAVGAPFENDDAGAVYVFAWDGESWTEEARLQPTNTSSDQLFGFALAMTEDRLLIGAPWESSGSGGVNNFGEELVLPRGRSGAAYLFERFDGEWTQTYFLKNDDPGSIFDTGFGGGVAMSESDVVVAYTSGGLHVWAPTD